MKFRDVKPLELPEYPKKFGIRSDHTFPLDRLSEESRGEENEAICTTIMAHVCFSNSTSTQPTHIFNQ